MTQLDRTTGRARASTVAGPTRAPTAVLVAARLLTAAGVLLLLRGVLIVALAAADGRIAGSYALGAVLGLLTAGGVPLLLGRGLRLRQPRIRLWTTVVSVFTVVVGVALAGGGRTALDQVVGVVGVVGAVTVVVSVFLPESRRWFGRA